MSDGMDAKPLALIYTRVSTKRQADEGLSLEEQKRKLTTLAASNDWRYEVFPDAGRSGESIEGRPGLLRLLSRLDEADYVLVVDDSRLARDDVVSALIRKQFRLAKIRLVTPGGERDLSDPSDNFVSAILGAASSYEQALRTAKSRDGMWAAAALGLWPGGPPPYGREIEKTDDGHARLVLNSDEAQWLRQAIQKVIEGDSTTDVAAWLNACGFSPRRARRFTGHLLRRLLLEGKSLSGTHVYGLRQQAEDIRPLVYLEVPPVITPGDHDLLRAALARTATRRRRQHFYLLGNGHLFGVCGDRCHGLTNRKLVQYRCNSSLHTADPRCGCKRINAADADTAAWNAITGLLTDEDRLRQMADDYLATRSVESDATDDALDNALRMEGKAKKALHETLGKLMELGLDPEVISEKATEAQEQLDHWRRQVSAIKSVRAQSGAASSRSEMLAFLASTARERLPHLSDEERKEIVKLLDLRVHVRDWSKCETCEGRGKVRGGTGGQSCPECRGTRTRPSFRIEGVIFDHLLGSMGGDEIVIPPLAEGMAFSVES